MSGHLQAHNKENKVLIENIKEELDEDEEVVLDSNEDEDDDSLPEDRVVPSRADQRRSISKNTKP